jgi:hypothetical protein
MVISTPSTAPPPQSKGLVIWFYNPAVGLGWGGGVFTEGWTEKHDKSSLTPPPQGGGGRGLRFLVLKV